MTHNVWTKDFLFTVHGFGSHRRTTKELAPRILYFDKRRKRSNIFQKQLLLGRPHTLLADTVEATLASFSNSQSG